MLILRSMNYSETLEFLFSQLPAYHRIGKAAYKNNLDNTLKLDEYFGHPHRNFKSIHIAGTNGKGSVSHMTASILQEAGFITGLYTSPHLRDFRERIRVNGEMISEQEVISWVEQSKEIVETVKPSFFEMTVAMALDYFSRMNVDIAVIEVGLGGRLDSTNIITPLVCVITNIGHDHMDLLGDTIEKVAIEKAGIIKEGVPVVIGETQKITTPVFMSKADRMHSVISFADKEFSCRLRKSNPETPERTYTITDKAKKRDYEGITVLGGDYQEKNLVTVRGLFRSLEGILNVTEENIREGIRKVVSNTGIAGRWQIIGKDPLTICDTGHNKEGLGYVTSQLRRLPGKLHMIIGFVNDKDLAKVLPLLPVDAKYYFTKASVERALDENILMKNAIAAGLKGSSYPDVMTAYEAAKRNASKEDVIFIGGSTFIVADIVSPET